MYTGGKEQSYKTLNIIPTNLSRPKTISDIKQPEIKSMADIKLEQPIPEVNQIKGINMSALNEYLNKNTFHKDVNSSRYTLSTPSSIVTVKTESISEKSATYPNNVLDLNF